jgi:RNA polymerase sigma-70 factor (ECF subfamily)
MTSSRPAAALEPPDELVRRAAGGDEAAFARLIRLHNETITRVAFVVTGDRAAAADAADAAWVEAWPGLQRRPSAAGLGSWLASLAASQAVVLVRGAPAGESLAPVAPMSSPAPGPGFPADADPATDAGLATTLARMGPEDRARLALLHVAGLTPREAAAAGHRSRFERLAAALRSPRARVSSADPTTAAVISLPRLRAYAQIPVRPIDADAIARRARAEAALERTRVASVAISAAVGILVVAHPYLVGLLARR